VLPYMATELLCRLQRDVSVRIIMVTYFIRTTILQHHRAVTPENSWATSGVDPCFRLLNSTQIV